MALYKIDYNRGSDSNNGTTAPFKNLSKITGLTLASGDIIALANDSYWEQTNRVALPTSTAGTQSNPVLITNYDPGGYPTTKPRISFRRSIPANEWTYDEANNGWYWDCTPIATGALHWGAYVAFGGEDGWRQGIEFPLPMKSRDKTWKESTKFLYVYAPAGTDPTTYYGSVEFGHSHQIFTFNNSANYLIVENIRVERGAGLIFLYSNGGTRKVVIRNCESYNAAMPVRFGLDPGSNMTGIVEDNNFNESQTTFVAIGSGPTGSGHIYVRRNKCVGGGRSWPSGQIYTQSKMAWCEIIGNDLRGARYGTPYAPTDGCAVYTETGAERVIVAGNYIHDCYQAMQDNSGGGVIWMGNLVANCFRGMHLTDQESVGAMNHRFYNNTLLVGVPIQPEYGSMGPGKGWRAFGSETFAFDVRNNIIVDVGGNCDKAGILTPEGEWSGTLSHNLVYGFPAIAAKEFSSGAGVTPEPTNSIDDDPLLTSGVALSSDSPCKGTGTYIKGAKHYGMQEMSPSSPDIGAIRYLSPRTSR